MSKEEEHPIIATDLFLYTSGIPELDINDFTIASHAADGGSGSVFKYTRKSDPSSSVAMKFFGMKGCSRPDPQTIEEELVTDWKMNNIKSTAECYGYIIDSFEGYAAEYSRPDLRAPGQFMQGKTYKGRYLVKVSECLEKDVMGLLMEEVHFTNRAASTVFRNLILALKECHDKDLIHRDLKPENFMFVKPNISEDAVDDSYLPESKRSEDGKDESEEKSATSRRRLSGRMSLDINTTKVHDLDIKLIDFGASAYLKKGEDELEYFGPPKGTALYYAPETLQRRVHSKASDIWQAGCTLWVILFTEYPFKHNTVHDLDVYNKTRRVVLNPRFNAEDLEFPDHKMKITENCKDLFRRMFDLDVSKRITCAEILSHSWIRDFATLDDDDFGEQYRKGLRKFKHLQKMKRSIEQQVDRRNAIKQSILREINSWSTKSRSTGVSITTSQNSRMKQLFLQSIGYDGESPINLQDGINCETFCDILVNVDLPQLATQRIFLLFDVDNSDIVDYFEFFSIISSFREVTSVSSKIDSKESSVDIEREENCRFYFEIFDYDGTDRISRDEFHAVMAQLMLDYEGMQFDDVFVTDMFSFVDLDRTGYVNFSEFRGWFECIFDTTQSLGLTRLSSHSSTEIESQLEGKNDP